MACPDPEALDAFARGELDADARAALERHLDGCEVCALTLAELARLYGTATSTTRVATAASETPPAMAHTLLDGQGGADERPLPVDVEVGRYRLGRRLGAGGMGVVFAAEDPDLHRRVAIKLLHPTQDEDVAKVQQRLLREARAMARLTHPNVVAVHDVGRFGEQVFVAMELVDGETLTQWVGAQPRSRDEVLRLFVQAGRGLAAAHEVGLVHRDFKPDNVLVGEDGRARVTDFGLARSPEAKSGGRMGNLQAIQAVVARHTAQGAVAGTPAYMAPEQWRGAETDARTDQFAFCVALYEALFHQRPFAGETLEALADSVVRGAMQPVPRAAPRWLRSALQTGLAVRPDDRHASMKALLHELSRDRGAVRRAVPVVVAMGLGVVATVGVFRWMANQSAPTEAQELSMVPTAQMAPTTDALSCTAPSRLANTWTPARRTSLQQRLSEMHKKASLAERTISLLDAWVERFERAEAGACRVGAEANQSAERHRCLQAGAHRFDALLQHMREVESWRLQHGASVAYALPPPERCAHEGWLALAPPEEPAPPPEAKLLRGDIAALLVGLTFRRPAELEGKRLVERARALEYAPIVAEAELAMGLIMAHRHDTDRAVQWLTKAAVTAEAAQYRRVQLEAGIQLIVQQGALQKRPSDAKRWLRMVDTLSASVADPWLEGQVDLAKGRLELALGNVEQAQGRFERALVEGRKQYPEGHPEVAVMLTALAEALARKGDGPQAIRWADEAAGMMVRMVGPEDLQRRAAGASRARARLAAGQLEVAEGMANAAANPSFVSHSVREELDTARYHDLHGDILRAMGRPQEALEAYRKAILYRFKAPERALPLTRRGRLLIEMGRVPEGLKDLEAAVDAYDAAFGEDPRWLELLSMVGAAEAEARRFDAGRKTLLRALAIARNTVGFGPLLGRAHLDLARLELKANRPQQALKHYDDAHVPLAGTLGQDHPSVVEHLLARADLAWQLGKKDYAGRLYRSAEQQLSADDPRRTRAQERASPED